MGLLALKLRISNLLERLGNVFLQVFDIFKADRQADETVRYAKMSALLGRNALVGRGCGMSAEAFCIAKIIGDVDQLHRIHKTEGALLAAVEIEADHRSEIRHLFLGKLMLRM